MSTSIIPESWKQRSTLSRLFNGSLLFLILLISLWLITLRQEAAVIILLLLLFVTAINFSLPVAQGAVGLVPIVSVTTILILDAPLAVLTVIVGTMAAWLARPFWNPLWENIDVDQPKPIERFGRGLVFLISLLIGIWVYDLTGGQKPPDITINSDVFSFTILAFAYGITYSLLSFMQWVISKKPWRLFLREYALSILGVSLLAQPVSLFGATVFGAAGLPIFVIFSLSILIISILLWLTWQRRFVLEKRLYQFSILNSGGVLLRESLDLSQVIERTGQATASMIAADSVKVSLLDEEFTWGDPLIYDQGNQTTEDNLQDITGTLTRLSSSPNRALVVDDFTKWVMNRGKSLEVTPQNIHFAQKHDLLPPEPKPVAWLGVPLRMGENIIGVLVVQRYKTSRPFTRWDREVLLAVAGQASAAVQNARLYNETVRLYNSTDQALAQRLQQLQSLLDTMQEGVLMLDRTGKVVLINNVAARLLAQSAEELRSKKFDLENMAAKLGHDQEKLKDILLRLEAGILSPSTRNIFQTPVGGEDPELPKRNIERIEAPVSGKGREIIGWLMLFRDVTEELELAEQRQDLTRMIVHDLRNPVTTFITNMNFVESTLPVSSESAPALEAVIDARQSSYDMLDMVDSLMDINRMEAGQFVAEVEAVDMASLVKRVIHRLEMLADQRNIDLAYDLDRDLPLVWADEDMIRRVLVNLIDNALKFTPQRGRIHCRVLLEKSDRVDYEPGARCIVSDTGPGIPKEHRSQIFNRFTRTNQGGAQIRGTGLGLTFCRLAIEAHGGQIWVEEHMAGGSKFIFTLPGIPIIQEEI